MSVRAHVLAAATILAISFPLVAQEPDSVAVFEMDTIPAHAVAQEYAPVFEQLRRIQPNHNRVATITDPISLQREGIGLTFTSGNLVQLNSVLGRVIGVGFSGAGTYTFSPTDPVEQEQLLRRLRQNPIETEFQRAVILFGDETLAELDGAVEWGVGNGNVGNTLDRTIEYLFEKFPDTGPDVMRTILNGSHNDLFYAHIKPNRGSDMIVMVNPWSAERNILRRVEGDGESRVVSQFGDRARRVGDRLGDATVSRYDLDVSIPRTGAGNLTFNAVAGIDIVAESEVGPWLPFHLYSELEIDSVQTEDGNALPFFDEDDSPYFWFRAAGPINPGDTLGVKVYYHGEPIDRIGDFFFLETSISWYPRSLNQRARATFETVFHTPSSYEFASAGELIESSEADGVRTTRWRSRTPMRNAGFNLGPLERYEVEEGDGPGVTVLYSEEFHRQLRQLGGRGFSMQQILGGPQTLQSRNMEQQVGADVTNSINFFENRFGPSGLSHFYATEIPYAHGEAFVGMVHLALYTFVETTSDGFEEWFRAHEVAHQWWGIGVDYATYRDRWLSEGMASFAALWYLQTVRHENDQYFNMLRDWRTALGPARGDPDDMNRGWGPIALGHRVWDYDEQMAYNAIVYQKGAWVVHMLRTMMLDLQTMDETPFTEMMRDFFLSYRGGDASTDDFQRFTENHIGMPMDWFFDQWVRGTYIPKYIVRWKSERADGGRYRLRVDVRQERVPQGFRAYVPIAVDFGENRQARLRVEVNGDGELQLPLMPLEPRGIMFNALEGVLADVEVSRWR